MTTQLLSTELANLIQESKRKHNDLRQVRKPDHLASFRLPSSPLRCLVELGAPCNVMYVLCYEANHHA
jgi:hypothetical protein